MYNEFHKLYEEALAAFIEKQGASVKNFYREIRQAFEENENSDDNSDDQTDCGIFIREIFWYPKFWKTNPNQSKMPWGTSGFLFSPDAFVPSA